MITLKKNEALVSKQTLSARWSRDGVSVNKTLSNYFEMKGLSNALLLTSSSKLQLTSAAMTFDWCGQEKRSPTKDFNTTQLPGDQCYSHSVCFQSFKNTSHNVNLKKIARRLQWQDESCQHIAEIVKSESSTNTYIHIKFTLY
jgi:hypothetical protein